MGVILSEPVTLMRSALEKLSHPSSLPAATEAREIARFNRCGLDDEDAWDGLD